MKEQKVYKKGVFYANGRLPNGKSPYSGSHIKGSPAWLRKMEDYKNSTLEPLNPKFR